jgi:hypothetical protein
MEKCKKWRLLLKKWHLLLKKMAPAILAISIIFSTTELTGANNPGISDMAIYRWTCKISWVLVRLE